MAAVVNLNVGSHLCTREQDQHYERHLSASQQPSLIFCNVKSGSWRNTAVVQKKKGEVLLCYIAAHLKSMKDMQKCLKLVRMFSDWFYFFQ